MATLPQLPPVTPAPRSEPDDTTDGEDNANAATTDAEDARYRAFAREKYDDLFEELEFRCQRAAMMHYYEANTYSKHCYYMELAAALLSAASVSGIGAFLLKWTSSSSGSVAATASSSSAITASRLGLFGLLGVAVSALLEFASKGSSKLIPTFAKRAEAHKKAAVWWQKLTRLTRSRRIQLRCPSLSVEDYVAWYADLVRQRQMVSTIAMVPSATYRAFNDPARVFAAIRRRRDMFQRYQQMFQGKLEVKDDDYDDDWFSDYSEWRFWCMTTGSVSMTDIPFVTSNYSNVSSVAHCVKIWSGNRWCPEEPKAKW